jgi:hypothetical protein
MVSVTERNFIGMSLEPLRGSDTECFYTRPNFRSLHPPEICNTSEGCSSRDLLYESQALESAHQSAASKGDTAAPSAETKVDLHYVCFVKSTNNHLWELDGRRKGPLIGFAGTGRRRVE